MRRPSRGRSGKRNRREILAALREENLTRCVPPLDDDEVRHAAKMASKYEPGVAEFKETDLSNARRFASQNSEVVRCVHDLKKWFIWTGAAWQPDPDGEAIRLAKAVVESLHLTA